jgi:tripartite-type tricarboxylate transporter receptor subunit TctC
MKYLITFILAACTLSAYAQKFDPTKNTIEIVISTAPGGPTDTIGRAVADYFTSQGIKALPINRPGANRTLAASYVAQQVNSPYTLLVGASSDTVSAPLMKLEGLQYDENTLQPVGMIGFIQPVIVANPNVIRSANLRDFLTEFKQNQQRINFGTIGASGQVIGYELGEAIGVEPVIVTYKSSGQLITDLLGGNVQVGIVDLGAVKSLVQDGRLTIIAMAKNERSREFPNIGSISEVIPGFSFSFWFGLFAPPGTSQDIVEFWSQKLSALHLNSDFQNKMDRISVQPQSMNSIEFSRFYRNEIKVIKKSVPKLLKK